MLSASEAISKVTINVPEVTSEEVVAREHEDYVHDQIQDQECALQPGGIVHQPTGS
jgi:hypothetical protein